MDRRTAEIIEKLREFKDNLDFESDMILFGSRARGDYGESSDVDVIVISKHFENKRFRHRSPELYSKWELDYPVDFICYTHEEFEKRSNLETIAKTAKEEGVVI